MLLSHDAVVWPPDNEGLVRRFPSFRLGEFAARFGRAERGATAVEFALISLPLIGLILGTLELALILLVVTTLETATEAASRQIRTGEFQTGSGATRGDFKALVCGRMRWLSGQCNANLTVTAQVFNDFGTMAGTPPMTGHNFVPNGGCFATGAPSDIVLVRAYFTWPLFAPLLNQVLDNMGDGKRLLSSATAFRNEPYSDTLPTGAAC
jgi:Flp pilus assembly protein TadG